MIEVHEVAAATLSALGGANPTGVTGNSVMRARSGRIFEHRQNTSGGDRHLVLRDMLLQAQSP